MNKEKEEIKKKIAVIYCRVSTQDQADKGLSIEEQERLCKEKAEQAGYSILAIIKDEGKSGGSLKRAGMQQLMKLSIEKKIDAVFTVHSDRIARNTENYLYLRALFRNNDVELFFIQLPNLDDSAGSKMMDSMFAIVNQYQRDITSDKVTMTMEGKARLGYFPALAPLGYKNITRPDPTVERAGQKIVVKDPEVAPLVKKGFELCATGNFSVFDITDILYEKGLRTKYGKKLSYSRLYDVLRNPFYIGEVNWGKVRLKEGKHEHLIEKDLFYSVQRLLTMKNGHLCRRRKYQWLLSGFLRCHTHQCRYTAEYHLNKKIGYYHCTNRNGCGKYVEVNKLESMIEDKFKEIEFSQKFIDLVIEKVKSVFYERRKLYEDKRKSLINQKTVFELKRKSAEDKLLANVITDDDFRRIKEDINEELENLNKRTIELEKERRINMDVAQEVLNLSRNIYDTYSKAPHNLKRHLLAFFWEKFEIKDEVIIKSYPSLLFAELLKLEQAFYKKPNRENPYESKGFPTIIKSTALSAR
ncbi:MAG: recombinase family protein [Candidatus Paceibacterota bacterium]